MVPESLVVKVLHLAQFFDIASLIGGQRVCKRRLGSNHDLAHAHRLELHLVASQRASLVRENIMQLAHVLDDAHVFDLAALVLLQVVHLPVLLDEPCDEELYHFGRDEQRDRDQRIQQLEVADECEETFDEA